MKTVNPIKYWKNGAADDLDTAEELFKIKKYHHCLFFLHLSLEKLLKALHQHKKNQPAPPIHKLTRLAEISSITLDDTSKAQLSEISTFNISARYDDYKQSFYQKATKEYAQKWLKNGKRLYQHFLSLLP